MWSRSPGPEVVGVARRGGRQHWWLAYLIIATALGGLLVLPLTSSAARSPQAAQRMASVAASLPTVVRGPSAAVPARNARPVEQAGDPPTGRPPYDGPGPRDVVSSGWTNLYPSLRAVSASSSTDAWAAGEYGHVLHYTGGAWVPVDPAVMQGAQSVGCGHGLPDKRLDRRR